MNTDEVDAQAFLSEYNSTAEDVWNAYTEASWKYNTDINDANKNAMVRSVIPIWPLTDHYDHLNTVQSSPINNQTKTLCWFLLATK